MQSTKPNRTSLDAPWRSGIRSGWASPTLLHRFAQESQVLARLHHPGIAQVYEAGTADSATGTQPFFAMEFIAGGLTLTEYVAENHFDTKQWLTY